MKMQDYDDKDLAIVAVLIIAIVYAVVSLGAGSFTDSIQLARDCILVLGSVATGKALAKKE